MTSQFTIPTGFHDILKDLNREILREQPNDIVQYCANYFAKKVDTRPAGGQKATTQSPAGTISTKPVSDDPSTPNIDPSLITSFETLSNPASDASDSDDDVIQEMQAKRASHNRNRRTSVSAESMAPAVDSSYQKIVIPKSEDQRGRIDQAIRSNFLFKSLDEEQYVDVVDAMAEKKSRAW